MKDNTITAECHDIFETDALKELFPYQADHLRREFRNFLALNKASHSCGLTICPKCGEQVDHFKRGGYTYVKAKDGSSARGKQLLKCPCCGHRFTTDHGQLSFYSQSDSSVWAKVIQDTAEGVSLEKTAAEINRHPTTVFRMRHKFLSFLEEENEENVINKPCEADEKYISESHKGLVDVTIDETSKTIIVGKIPRKKLRGISHQKVCLGTVVERGGSSYIEATNTGKPSTEDLEKFCGHIQRETYVWTDELNGYSNILKNRGCPHKEIKSTTPYNQVDHLNTVNNLHSQIDEWIRKYRNVGSIYINRYASLFALRQKTTGMDLQEIVLKVIAWIRQRCRYFRTRDIQKEIFRDPSVMEERKNRMGWPTIRRMMQYEGYRFIKVDSLSSLSC